MDNENLDNLFDDVFSGNDAGENPGDAPADDDGKQAGETGEQKGGEPEENQPEESEAEKRSRNAERRIRREKRIADEAHKAAWADASRIVAELGIEDADGNTVADMDALKKLAEERRKERMRLGNPTEADIRHIVDEQMRQPEEAQVQAQLDMIRDMDPEMTDLSAILKSDIGEDFRKAVEDGKTFIQAYGQALRLKTAREKGEAGSAAAKAAGKSHLQSTSQRGTGALDVPADELAIFRELNPGASDEDIRKYYNKDRKRFGG